MFPVCFILDISYDMSGLSLVLANVLLSIALFVFKRKLDSSKRKLKDEAQGMLDT